MDPASVRKDGHAVRAEARVILDSPREAEILRRAMSVDEKPGSKSSVSATAEGGTLVLKFTAYDSNSLRAVMNSSLREVKIANDMLI